MARPITNEGDFYVNGRYKRNAEKHRKYCRDRRNRRKKEFVEQLGGACMDCGGVFPVVCMDFHHRDESTKNFEVGKALDRNLEVLKEEVAKCDLLCSNCHRIRHAIEDDK